MDHLYNYNNYFFYYYFFGRCPYLNLNFVIFLLKKKYYTKNINILYRYLIF